MNKSLKINAFLNSLKNVLNVLFPLITFPYVSRVLDVSAIGKYNFANSIVSYFTLMAGLGISTYAIREGARLRDDRKLEEKFASQIFSINIWSTIFSYVLMFVLILLFQKLHSYWLVICIFSLQIFFTTIGTEWIYSIHEEYMYITFRSIVFKILSLVLLFLFVKKSNDYLIYAGITVFATVGSNILNFFHAKKFCNIRLITDMNLKIHLKPIFIIFASNIAIMIYVNSDITILGLIQGNYSVGIYSVSVKVYNVVKTVLSAVLIVTIPRLAMLYGKNRYGEFRQILSKVFNALVLLTAPAVVGLFSLSREVVLLIAGKNYVGATGSLRILSFALLFSIFSWIYSECVLIPAKMEKVVLIATVISATMNVVLNFIFIEKFGVNAAAFSTVVSEALMLLITWSKGKKIVSIDNVVKNSRDIFLGCLGIMLVCQFIKKFELNYFVTLPVCILFSCMVYFGILLIMKNSFIYSYIYKLKKK
ncbi:MAG: flippase [Liquorilactobacillus hordei]|uniref:flippase n=1 Tax=Liquorilactobacillus hordei TaxID=468911 RepID=UPI0039ED891F